MMNQNPGNFTITCDLCGLSHVPFSYDNAVNFIQTHDCKAKI